MTMMSCARRQKTRAGYSASAFASTDEFLKSEQVSKTSCLITDLNMPGLSGSDLQDHLSARGHRTLFSSRLIQENVRTRAMKAGAVGFLGKPFNPDHLLSILRRR
jgi:FixJ family two-component response regulator